MLGEYGFDYGLVDWCSDGLWVSSPELDTIAHQLGHYYIQTASSMLAPQLLDGGVKVLDMCAAPGGKSTHLAQLMGNEGLLVSNDDNISRLRALVYNLQRCGVTNASVTRIDGFKFPKLGETFDRILLDAPCSSVGTLNKSGEIMKKWDLSWVKQLAKVQKKLAESAFDCLSPGGRMVYSTCTTTKEENELVIEHLLDSRADASIVKCRLDGIKFSRGLTERTFFCGRVWPHIHGSDMNFLAVVEKNG